MKFIAKLKTKRFEPECFKMIGESPRSSLLDIDWIGATLINNLNEEYNSLYFLHDMLDEDWVWMNGLPEHNKKWWSQITFTGRSSGRTRGGDLVKSREVTKFYFLLSSNGDKLIIRLEFFKSECSDGTQNNQDTFLMGYSGSKKQLQEDMKELAIQSSFVDKVYLNEFSSRNNPWIQDDYYAD